MFDISHVKSVATAKFSEESQGIIDACNYYVIIHVGGRKVLIHSYIQLELDKLCS
jgi:hypothetical protein